MSTARDTSGIGTDDERIEGELSPQEAWELFDGAVRLRLKMSGERFVELWRAGGIPCDDREPAYTDMLMLFKIVPEDMLPE